MGKKKSNSSSLSLNVNMSLNFEFIVKFDRWHKKICYGFEFEEPVGEPDWSDIGEFSSSVMKSDSENSSVDDWNNVRFNNDIFITIKLS